jgi:hypothetical protein
MSMVSWSAATRRMVSSMNRVAPTPAVPSTMSAPASPADADCSSDAMRANASSRPTNRAPSTWRAWRLF